MRGQRPLERRRIHILDELQRGILLCHMCILVTFKLHMPRLAFVYR